MIISCSRKTALGIGLMSPSTTVDGLALKLHVGHKRAESKVTKMIKINEENARLSYGYSKNVIETEWKCKPNKITWSDEMQEKLSRRKLKIFKIL